MGTTPMRQFLISLCTNSHWKYAVFWRLAYPAPSSLTWEDGYFDDSATQAETSGIRNYDNYVDRAKGISFSSSENMHDIGFKGCPIGLTMANMSMVKYALGEGLVGVVAYTGNHMWVPLNIFFSREFESNLAPDWADECLLQVALGIKTVLLVPVLPLGVIQLGSYEAVAENHAVVDLVRDRFAAYCNMMECFPSALIINQPLFSSTQLSIPRDNVNVSTATSLKQLKCEELEDTESATTNDKILSTTKLLTTQQTVQHVFLAAEKEFKTTNEHETGFPEESVLSSLSESSLEILDNKIFGSSCLEEELMAYSLPISQNMDFWGNWPNGINPYSVGEMAAETIGVDHVDDGGYGSLSMYAFPADCELHKALGPPFKENTCGHLCCSSLLIDDAYNNKSSVGCKEDLMDVNGSSWFTGECDAEHLLEAIIANLSSLGDPSSSPFGSDPSCITSQGQFSTLCQSQVQSKEVPKMGSCSDQQNLTATEILARVDSSASLDGMASTLTNEEQQIKGHGRVQSGKVKKSSLKTSRMKNGNNQRPRPRDRQLIQDRVKELRELVPHGSKCSIDGLLDRTIKHMLYLRSVSDQAEKLKKHIHREAANDIKNQKLSDTNNAPQNGTSWAFEIGSEHQACPIVVEDLEFPGHMLIEVLCDDHGLFLEIAQLIRRLDLTVLKGTLENRTSNTWAHFVVEATKGFHRMEIFWPLLHLLQRKRSRISSRI